jgi:starch phosphorylase
LFGLTADEAHDLKMRGHRPRNFYEQNAALREVLDFIASGSLAGGDKNLFRPLVDNLLNSDPFMVLADYQSYVEAQTQVSALWHDQQMWTRRSILSVARMSKFSSDRSIRDYCRKVWQVQPMHVKMEAIEPDGHSR